jgi:cytochrome oxidase Cu insertion factor (SCO1/SenC/PrrC family)
MKLSIAVLLFLFLAVAAPARNPSSQTPAAAAQIGLAVGEAAPAFTLTDQFGNQQSNDSLRAPGGTILVFFRSADW